MTLKTMIKDLLPDTWILKMQRWKTANRTCREAKRDARRFAGSYAAPFCVRRTQIESLLIFFVRQTEKGLL